jgi:hypothetical protein|tara:strand:+ start:8894 stop:9058 length:165 start_codon:yes stop_codon:yes gene_type:complete
MSKRFLVPIEEDDYGEMTFKIPDTIVEELGWGVGDMLQYDIEDDHFIIRKADDI